MGEFLELTKAIIHRTDICVVEHIIGRFRGYNVNNLGDTFSRVLTYNGVIARVVIVINLLEPVGVGNQAGIQRGIGYLAIDVPSYNTLGNLLQAPTLQVMRNPRSGLKVGITMRTSYVPLIMNR